MTKPVAAADAFQFDAVVIGLGFLADGRLAVALGDGLISLIRPGGPEQPLTVRPHTAQAALLAAAVDVDGMGLLTGGDDGRLMRADSGGATSLLGEFPGQQLDVIAVNAASGLRGIAAGREIRLIDQNGQMLGSTSDHPSAVTGLAFNPKGKRLAAAHYGGVSLWWTSSLGRNVRRLDCKGSHIAVTWSPDGSAVMSSMQGNELHGWQLESGANMRMRGYSTKVRAMDWSTKPMTLLTSGADSVIAWKFSGGGPMGKPPTDIGRGIGRLVTAVAVRPRQPFVAAGFDDGQVAVCSTKDGPIMRVKPSDGDRIGALAWSANGRWLACGSASGSVSVFDLTNETK